MTTKKEAGNFAFIDSQNIHKGVEELHWHLDWRRFRVYLKDKYRVSKAYIFIGFIAQNQQLYTYLQKADFILMFKPVLGKKTRVSHGHISRRKKFRSVAFVAPPPQ